MTAVLAALAVGTLVGADTLDRTPGTAPRHNPAAVRLAPHHPPPPSAAAVVAPLEHRLPYVAMGGRRRREVALTFDDGPGPYTLRLLRVLKRRHVPATFFQVGFMVQYFPGAERALRADRATVLGNHTESHPRLAGTSAAFQAAQVDGALAAQRAAGVPRDTLFRPPYGLDDATTRAVLRARGLLTVLWSIDSHDYLRPGTSTIVARVLDQARPGSIVLMHDAGGDRTQTIAALPAIVTSLRRRGYRLVTVPQLLRDNPPPPRQPRLGGAG